MKYFIRLLLLLPLFATWQSAHAQLLPDNKMLLQDKEDTLRGIGRTMVYDTIDGKRIDALHHFIPCMARALKIEGSFYYAFDSLDMISSLYAPDSSFRILTWQLYLGKGINRYYGTIQMRDNKLRMIPLFDASDTMAYHSQAILDAQHWWGCLYYKILKNYSQGKYYYTLLGYDAADYFSDRKIADVMYFEGGYPKFGAPIFRYKYRDGRVETRNRIFIDYKFDATASLTYDTAMHMIVFDHTEPEDSANIGAGFTYLPDGTYEGFKFENGFWNWVQTVFTFAINENDHPPLPRPLFDKTKDTRFR
jgi:hypothetical protein